MYLISQLWWYLSLAFLLGTLVGYLLWRACGKTRLQSEAERARKELTSRLHALESERSQFTSVAVDSEAGSAKLKSDLAAYRAREEAAVLEAQRLGKDVSGLRQSFDTEKAAAKAHEEKLAGELAAARKLADEAARKHGDELKKARDQVAAELSSKHAEALKKARDEAVAEAAKKHSEELARVRTSVADEAAKKHADELKKAREHAAAEAAQRQAVEVERARAAALEEAARKHADELAKVRAAAAASVAAAASTAAAKPAAAPPSSPDHGPERLTGPRGGKADDLKLIWSVGPEIEKLLNTHGIYHFEQIATWTRKDIDWLDGALTGFEGRAAREKWVEQAAKLATGWRPERDIGDKPMNLLTAPKGGKADDLKLIWGVGPKLEQMLNEHGIWHFSQIAAWTQKELAWVDSQLGTFAGRAVRDKWVEQSAKLATGWRPENEVGDKPV